MIRSSILLKVIAQIYNSFLFCTGGNFAQCRHYFFSSGTHPSVSQCIKANGGNIRQRIIIFYKINCYLHNGLNVAKSFVPKEFYKNDFFSKIKWMQKMAVGFFIFPRHSETHFELKAPELSVK